MTNRQRQAAPAVLALDIGGTKLAAGVVDGGGRVLSFAVQPTDAREGPDDALQRLFDLGHQAVEESGLSLADLAGTGIGCGGPLDCAKGVLLCPPHLPGWTDVPVTELATRAYGLPAVLDNDGTAAAAGEWRFGAGRGSRHLVYLTVSTGIGGGFVIDGRTYRGAAGNGGEPGHITVRSDGRLCKGCGRHGCLEAYASGTSIAERAREAVAAATARGTTTALAGCDPLTSEDVAAAARAGDPVARLVWDETAEALASGLTSIVNLHEPGLVLLGGGVTRSGEQLLGPVRSRVAARAMGPAARAVRIALASGGDRVGVLGAAAVARERLIEADTDPVAALACGPSTALTAGPIADPITTDPIAGPSAVPDKPSGPGTTHQNGPSTEQDD